MKVHDHLQIFNILQVPHWHCNIGSSEIISRERYCGFPLPHNWNCATAISCGVVIMSSIVKTIWGSVVCSLYYCQYIGEGQYSNNSVLVVNYTNEGDCYWGGYNIVNISDQILTIYSSPLQQARRTQNSFLSKTDNKQTK